MSKGHGRFKNTELDFLMEAYSPPERSFARFRLFQEKGQDQVGDEVVDYFDKMGKKEPALPTIPSY